MYNILCEGFGSGMYIVHCTLYSASHTTSRTILIFVHRIWFWYVQITKPTIIVNIVYIGVGSSMYSKSHTTETTGCPKKHGNLVTNWISSLLWISIVIPNFKSHNIIMSARAYFMKSVNSCKDVFIMSPQEEQWRQSSLLCLYTAFFLFY